MQKRADAFAQYNEAAVLDLLVKVLPELVGKASEPLAAVDKLTIISTDGTNKLTKQVADNVGQGLQIASDLTGMDIPALLAKLGGGAATKLGALTSSADGASAP